MLTQDAAVQLQSFAVVCVPAAAEGQAMSRTTTWRSDGSSRTPELPNWMGLCRLEACAPGRVVPTGADHRQARFRGGHDYHTPADSRSRRYTTLACVREALPIRTGIARGKSPAHSKTPGLASLVVHPEERQKRAGRPGRHRRAQISHRANIAQKGGFHLQGETWRLTRCSDSCGYNLCGRGWETQSSVPIQVYLYIYIYIQVLIEHAGIAEHLP